MSEVRIADEDFDWSFEAEAKEEEILEGIPVEYEGYPLAGDWEEWEEKAVQGDRLHRTGRMAFLGGLTFILGWLFIWLSLVWNK